MTHRVSVKPEMIRWARERAALTQKNLAARAKQLQKLPEWESGEIQPTLRQLEAFARAVHVPFGYLFLAEPPEERLPVADFRTVASKAKTRASPDLIDTLYTMQLRQAWLSEYLEENEADPLPFAGRARLADDPGAVGREMRRTLGLDAGWAAGVRTWQEAVSELRRMIEQLGVMAVINGIVGNNTRRRLDVTEFRGFALADPYAPLIFVNGADSKSAQMFTLAHELAHIWLGEEGLSGFDNLLPGGTDVEDWCNEAAAEFLVPSHELGERWQQANREQHPFEALGRSFKVSPVVVARRAMDFMLMERHAFFEFYKSYVARERQGSPASSGGDFYNSQNARVGKLFATYVIRAALGGEIGFKEAYELTGLRGQTFETYAARLEIRFH